LERYRHNYFDLFDFIYDNFNFKRFIINFKKFLSSQGHYSVKTNLDLRKNKEFDSHYDVICDMLEHGIWEECGKVEYWPSDIFDIIISTLKIFYPKNFFVSRGYGQGDMCYVITINDYSKEYIDNILWATPCYADLTNENGDPVDLDYDIYDLFSIKDALVKESKDFENVDLEDYLK
jgi:hypothetical protein